MSRIAEFSVKQTVLVNVLFVVCLVGGCNALRLTEVEYFHDVTLNEIVISTAWPGAAADEVERLVTAEIEEELRTLSHIAEMRSASQANLSQISVEFDETLNDAEYESAVNDVRGALDRVTTLPEDAKEPVLTEIITTEVASVVMIAVADHGGVGDLAIRDVAQQAATRLRELPGVSRVTLRGLQDREVRVLVDRARAAAYGLTVEDIAARVRRQNQNLPAGQFQDASGEATLRATGDYEALEEILDTVVREDAGGTPVLLRDVARVERGLAKHQYVTRYNGHGAAVIDIAKQDKTDVRELVERVDAWLLEFAPLAPPGVALHKTLDTAAFVTPRIGVLVDNLITGMLLVLALLWFTIGFRNALLTIIAIPFSFLTALIFFPIFDISINSNTLIGMLLVSGMLVDDAIIVLENIYRKIEAGLPLREAVVSGTSEVVWPVSAAVLTTVAAFLPLLLVEGTAGKFVSVLPKAVVVCLIASLFECLVILPAHYLDFGSRHVARAGSGGDARGLRRLSRVAEALHYRVDRAFETLRAHYLRALDAVLRHRASFIALLVAFLFATTVAAGYLKRDLFPGEFANFTINLEAPPNTSLEQTSALTREVEKILDTLPKSEITDYNTTVGLAVDLNYDLINAPNLALISVVIPQTEENQLRPERIIDKVNARLEAFHKTRPDEIVALRAESERWGPPIGRPVEVRIRSEDFALNKAVASEIKEHLRTLPGVFGVDDNLKEGPREVRLKLNAARAARYGLTFEDLARALRFANDGIVASSYRAPALASADDIRVLLEPGQRDRIADLLEVEVRAPGGELLKLRDIADLEVTRGYLSYRRFDDKRAVIVFADVDNDLASSVSVNRALRARFAATEERYPELELSFGGEFQSSNEAMRNTFAAFPVALLLIYMILAALFRSYLQPVVVFTSIPLGFAGIVAGVGSFGYSISFNLLYASVGLAGVVVNDAIVLVDFINRTRREGASLHDAVRRAGAIRLRPVILTTLTTVAALLPMALGLQGASKTYGPFASSIAFGLLFAMLGTLFVIPLSYTTLASLQERAREAWRRLAATLPAGSVAPTTPTGVGPTQKN